MLHAQFDSQELSRMLHTQFVIHGPRPQVDFMRECGAKSDDQELPALLHGQFMEHGRGPRVDFVPQERDGMALIEAFRADGTYMGQR